MNIKQLSFCASLLAATFAMAQAPAGYYSGLDGKTGVALKAAAKAAARNHTAISYGNSTWDAFKTTDVTYSNGQLVWWDMYSDETCYVSTGHTGLNIEHSVANSWWGGDKNDAYKDLFHLNPSNATANSSKSNYPLGEIATVTWTNGVTSVGNPVSGQGGGSNRVYEPPTQYKGDFARAFMYIFTIYDDIDWSVGESKGFDWMYDTSSPLLFKPWAYQLLLKWAKNDPVSQKEVDRNEAIYKIQKNRNPFIDYPELCDYIWGSKSGQAFNLATAVTPNPGATVDPDPDPDSDPNPNPVTSEWTVVKTLSELNNTKDFVLVSESNFNVMGCEQGGTTYASFLKTAGQTYIQGDELAAIGTNDVLPADAAILHFTQSGSNYIIEVSDIAGAGKGYMKCTAAKTISLTADLSDATPANISISSDNIATIKFGDFGTLQYNASSPRFTSYTSSQEKVKIFVKGDATNVAQIEEAPEIFLLGNNIAAPANAKIFDLQGRIITGENLAAGLYIVVTPNYTTKVMVR